MTTSPTKNYRAAAHIHSTFSYDGEIPLVELKEQAIDRGWQILFLSEHTDKLTPEDAGRFISRCQELSDDQILFIPGFEMPLSGYHIVMYGVYYFYPSLLTDIINQQKQAGALMMLAHPYKDGWQVTEQILRLVDFVEVWNSAYDGKYAPRPRFKRQLNKLEKRAGRKYHVLAGLDVHRTSHFGGPEIMINAASLSQADIANAMLAGEYEIVKGEFRFDSRGNLLSGSQFRLEFLGTVNTVMVVIAKKLSKFFVWLGLPVPYKLRQFLRKFF